MKFGSAEMAQMMDSAKALITVTIVSSVGTGIVLGAIYHLFCRHRAADHFRHRVADQSLQSGTPTVPALAIDATAPHSPRSPVPRANNMLRLVYLLGIIVILIAIADSKRSDFAATYNNQLVIQPSPPAIEPPQHVRSDFEETYKQLGIQPLPLTVERQPQIQSRLAQLSREVCYTDAIVGLGRALLDAGYPREAAISSRSFAKRCGSVSAQEVLPQAYTALQKLNDWSGALDVADELVTALPASATARYWRAMAYDNTGKFSQAMLDYMNTVQLIGDPKAVFGDVFYKWSRTYAALARYCDAISPIEMYIKRSRRGRRILSRLEAERWDEDRIGRFKEDQRRKREWISFVEIAEWYSGLEVPTNPKKAAAAAEQAYRMLQTDLLAGLFEEGGRSRVLFRFPGVDFTHGKMTRQRLQGAIDDDPHGEHVRLLLMHCWLPRKLFERWCEWHHLPKSPPRFQPQKSQRVLAATAGHETAAIRALGSHLRSNRDLKKGEALSWCRIAGFNLSSRRFQNWAWPMARKLADLEARAPAGRKRKSSR